MGIFEIIGELINPGPIGKMDFNEKGCEIRQRFILIRFIISLIIIGTIENKIVSQMDSFNDFVYFLRSNMILIIYFLLAAKIRIKPEFENLGWLPFIINNPFKYSDNVNRVLVILNILFMPGKYITTSIIGYYLYIKKMNE